MDIHGIGPSSITYKVIALTSELYVHNLAKGRILTFIKRGVSLDYIAFHGKLHNVLILFCPLILNY